MRKLVFYGAITLDGYLARENHSLDWLFGTEGEEEVGYEDFFKTIGTVIMGRKTYEQISEYVPDEFPYKEEDCYVFSRTLSGSNENVTFINEDIVEFTKALKEKEGKNIWVVGGGEVMQPLLEAKLIDEFTVQIAPALIGHGLPLFKAGDYDTRLHLKDVRQYKQFAEMHYELK
ncbi:dihydrofolate reductase family protein [Pseudalkalibacillus sp. Hm43]|uniref:dihydrofolate reductase family protein n=1 Tax=Pseudalkalibacillus sp. Hm43 TaxID=3450742 RepID=UPI003F41EA7F